MNAWIFRAAFTAAEGWGSFSQEISPQKQRGQIELKYGTLKLNELGLTLGKDVNPADVTIKLNNGHVPFRYELDGRRLRIFFRKPMLMKKGERLLIEMISVRAGQ